VSSGLRDFRRVKAGKEDQAEDSALFLKAGLL
jgi:hypothetical protein